MFSPTVGGLQTVSALLASEFVRMGHAVKLVTQSVYEKQLPLPYGVVRRPKPLKLLRLLRWCDVYFHNNISIRMAWPLLFVPRPWVVTHATWIPSRGVAGKLRHRVLGHAIGISISRAIARHVRTPSVVIGNPYDDAVFRAIPARTRDKELVFCGRLVADKGANLLLSALSILRSRKLYPRLTIIGSGSEEARLRVIADDLGIADQVTLAGFKSGRELAESLNEHEIMVVPSLWNEPFGVVALEGIACGCVILGSEGGGLKEAIGPCGITFPNGDCDALAARLEELLTSPQLLQDCRANATEHLSRHTRNAVGEKYVQVFAAALCHRSRESTRRSYTSAVESPYGLKYQ
jgi:glycogen(starch) synthase